MRWENDENRRKSSRFPIVREVRYRVSTRDNVFETGVGNTVNISSSGVLFTTERGLVPGRRIEMAISWPVELNRNTALKLVARGRVIRASDGQAAAEFQHVEFKTLGNGLGLGPAAAGSPGVIPFRTE